MRLSYAGQVLRLPSPASTPIVARLVPWLEGSLGAYLLYALCRFVRLTLRWPLVGDATLMHYCVLLLRHGVAPYRQIIDINLPGTYLLEWSVIRLFGYGALPWRLFDLCLLLFAGLAALTALVFAPVASPVDRPGEGEYPLRRDTEPAFLNKSRALFPALWAGTIFAVLHGRDGIAQLGQRDLVVTALLAIAVALLFRAFQAQSTNRRSEIKAMAGFGFAIGAATTIKPLALLLLPALLALYVRGRRPGFRLKPLTPPVAATLAALLPLLAACAFLFHQHAALAFWRLMLGLVPLHVSLFRERLPHLVTSSVSSVLVPPLLLALPVLISRKPWHCFEGASLLTACGFGLLSFCVQGRGYPYHRYPLQFFLLLLLAWVLPAALRSHETPAALRCLALLSLLSGALVVVPRSLGEIARYTPQTDTFDTALSSALLRQQAKIPGGLAGRVQCLDMAGGCVTTLLRLGLPQSTGVLYDCYAVLPVGPRFTREQQRYRSAWLGALAAHPPALIIATSDECGPVDFGYNKLTRWSALGSMLQSRYTLTSEWRPAVEQRWTGHAVLPYGFRIYSLHP